MLSRPLRCPGMAVGDISPGLHWSEEQARLTQLQRTVATLAYLVALVIILPADLLRTSMVWVALCVAARNNALAAVSIIYCINPYPCLAKRRCRSHARVLAWDRFPSGVAWCRTCR